MDWKPTLYQYSIHLAGNHWDAEDLMQDAWLKLNEALRKNPDRPVTKAFLYRIVKNTWIDIQRKNRIRTVPLTPNDDVGSPDPLLSSRELLEQLAERLPPRMAVILLLMDVFDFTAKETTAFVGMKEAAIQVALGRARRRLRDLAPYSLSDQPKPAGPERINYPSDLDALVVAFRTRNPGDIYRAYLGLTREGIHLTKLLTVGGRLHFTFRDMDGNLFNIVSK